MQVRKLRAEGKVVEPLKDFHKDEVRRLGFQLQLPRELVERHPFPGPGLAIRVLCQAEPWQEKDFAETQVKKKKNNLFRFYRCNIIVSMIYIYIFF